MEKLRETKDLTNDELRAYFSEHVIYEIRLLLNTALAIKHKLLVPALLKEAPLESFAIHLRNLVTFLYPTSHEKDSDVYAKHFFKEEGKWSEVRPPLDEDLDKARNRAHREVGHLTTGRVAGTPSGKEWDVERLTKKIIPLIEKFCDSANRVELKGSFENLLKEYR